MAWIAKTEEPLTAPAAVAGSFRMPKSSMMKTLAMTDRYMHLSPVHLHEAANQFYAGGSSGGSTAGESRAYPGTQNTGKPLRAEEARTAFFQFIEGMKINESAGRPPPP